MSSDEEHEEEPHYADCEIIKAIKACGGNWTYATIICDNLRGGRGAKVTARHERVAKELETGVQAVRDYKAIANVQKGEKRKKNAKKRPKKEAEMSYFQVCRILEAEAKQYQLKVASGATCASQIPALTRVTVAAN